MSATKVAPHLLSWGSDVEPATIEQAAQAARMPFIAGHVALMPDAHRGLGATIGSVIPTRGAIIPAAVGVDIGCGMVAAQTDLVAHDLPDNLDRLMPLIEERIPAGVGKGHQGVTWSAEQAGDADLMATFTDGVPREITDKQRTTIAAQFGTLGSGNHFVEVCLDEGDRVWVVLHSGSRGIGNQLAVRHIEGAKKLMAQYFISLADPDLAYLVEGTAEFDAYINDMLWAQRYALASRARMIAVAVTSLAEIVGHGATVDLIDSHHNFTQRETHFGREMWVTRKGAVKAAVGDRGIIPGSMGTRSYIVAGLGNPASYNSCAHGAGRRMSRNQARKQLTVDSLNEAMTGRSWNSDKANQLLDEHPSAYKDVDQVMADQSDLVELAHTLHQVFNYKGTT